MARISYVEKDKAPQEVAEIYTKMESRGAGVGGLWKIIAHSPTTLLPFSRLGNALLTKTSLDPKLREMAIVRQAIIIDCEYERRAHTLFGKEVGLTDEKLKAIANWENSLAFNEVEQAVLRFTDEVVKNVRVNDKTFNELAKHLDEQKMVELSLTIGFYGMIARILLPFKVDPGKSPTSSTQIVGRRTQGK